MVFVTVKRRLSGGHGLGIMLGELPCAQADGKHSLVTATVRFCLHINVVLYFPVS
jgi:hypothetical protein